MSGSIRAKRFERMSVIATAFLWLNAGVMGYGQRQTSDVPTAAQAISRWRFAAGIKSDAQHRYVKVRSTSTEDGIPGSVTEVVSPTSFRSETSRESDDSIVVLSAAIRVRKDWNGHVRTLQDDELARRTTAAYTERALFFGPDAGAKVLRTEKTDSPDVYRVVALPEGGKEVIWIVDAKTSLPRNSSHEGQDSIITTTYSDWKDFGGVKTPASAKITEADKPDYQWKRESVAFASKADSSAFSRPLPGPSDAILDPHASPIPFTMEADHIVMQTSVNGSQPIGFILDTGDDLEAINSKYVNEFKLKPYGKSETTGGGNSTDFLFAKDATFTWPGLTLKGQHVMVLDETGLERALGVKIGGLLGYDFISRFIIEIDYAMKLITMHDSTTWHYSGNGNIVPITFDEGVPFTHAAIDVKSRHGIPGYFAVDFGAMETMTLTSPFARSNDLYTLASNKNTVNETAGLENQFFAQQNVRGFVDELRLGTLKADSIPINMSVNTKGAYASKAFSGTIGEGIYKRYHTYLDYPHNRIILEPTPATNTQFPERRTYGLTVLASGPDLHTFTVTAVRPDSPAERDGFLKSDVISALDGQDAASFRLSQLKDALSADDTEHQLTVYRKTEEKQLKIHVRTISLEKQ